MGGCKLDSYDKILSLDKCYAANFLKICLEINRNLAKCKLYFLVDHGKHFVWESQAVRRQLSACLSGRDSVPSARLQLRKPAFGLSLLTCSEYHRSP
jgi:hypothetical protein